MGTGLGLSIVKEIIEHSGGKIACESVLDKGTAFRFWLPIITQEQEAQAQPPAGASSTSMLSI